MGTKVETYNWDQVMGSNVVGVTSAMLHNPTKILRSTRLQSEGKEGKVRLMYVTYDFKFVVWRLSHLLKNCDKYDIEKILQCFTEVSQQLESKVNNE
jgi:aspartate aminotransferase-like enzyme